MLVLSRARDEQVVFEIPPSAKPTHVVLTIVDIRGDKVRLGCDANRDVTIHRGEVFDAIARENGFEPLDEILDDIRSGRR